MNAGPGTFICTGGTSLVKDYNQGNAKSEGGACVPQTIMSPVMSSERSNLSIEKTVVKNMDFH